MVLTCPGVGTFMTAVSVLSVMILLITFPATFLSAGVVGACEDFVRMSRIVVCDGDRVDWVKWC